MEELKAMFRVCAHIKKDGVRCNSPAMKGMNFCYQHIGGNVRELTRARSIYNGPKLDFVYPGCRQDIQHNFFVIAQAMNDGKIDLQTANTYNRIYSACERNLRRFEDLYEKDAERELAPLPEAPESETSPTDVIPLSADVIPLPPADVIPTENLGGPLKPGFGLSGEQTDSTPSPTDDVILSEVDADRRQRVEGPAFCDAQNTSYIHATSKQRYLISRYSSMPYFDPSRPSPDCFTPPNGATSVEITPSLMPTIPYSSASATRHARFTSFV